MSAVKLQSRYNSFCKNCKGNVKVGEEVFWKPGEKGVVHVECPAIKTSQGTGKIVVEPLINLEPPAPREDFPGLFEHQREVVNTMEKKPDSKLYLAWEPGLGKTLGSLASAKVSDSFPLIIVCPSVVKINWQREAQRWIGKEAQILSGRKNYDIESDIIIINYDILQYWEDTLIKVGAKGIVFDESHYVKNPKSARTKAANKVAQSVKGMRFMLSGTPTPNSVYDLAAPLHMLDVLKHFGGRNRYVRRYCPPVETKWGTSYAKTYHQMELHRNLKNAGFIRRRKEDCLDLPEKIRVDIPVATKVKADMEFYGPLLEQMNKATLAEARRVVRELDKNEIKSHIATERYEAGMAKINEIVELAGDIEEPLVIMVHHKDVAAELMKKLKKRKPEKLVGGMTAEKRQQAVDKFQNGDTDVLICSISAAGVGINLQRGTQMIMGELPFTYAEVDQAESRCHRSGAKNDLTVHRIVAIGTFDEIIVNIIARKEATSAAVEDGEEIESVKTDDILARRLLELYTSTR